MTGEARQLSYLLLSAQIEQRGTSTGTTLGAWAAAPSPLQGSMHHGGVLLAFHGLFLTLERTSHTKQQLKLLTKGQEVGAWLGMLNRCSASALGVAMTRHGHIPTPAVIFRARAPCGALADTSWCLRPCGQFWFSLPQHHALHTKPTPAGSDPAVVSAAQSITPTLAQAASCAWF